MTRFATRLNSFAAKAEMEWPDLQGKPTALMMARRAARVPGLTHVDLNYPDHVTDDPRAVKEEIEAMGLGINGLAMRYYTNPAFKLGAFTQLRFKLYFSMKAIYYFLYDIKTESCSLAFFIPFEKRVKYFVL